MSAPAQPVQVVIDVNESNFASEVIARSRSVPVVVDFWAEWCGPCRVLGPLLDGLAKQHNGKFVLAKLNVDENQRLAGQYGIQGIPAVKAFRDGRVVDEFVGAQPQHVVRQFVERLLPSSADNLASEAEQLLASGKTETAEAAFRQILAESTDHAPSLLGLGKALLAQGRDEDAVEVLARIPPGTPQDGEASRLRVDLQLRREVGDASESELRAQVDANPRDWDALYRLAGLLALAGRHEDALGTYLRIVQGNRSYRNGAARLAMLHLFEVLGETPVTRDYRNRLASALFV